MYILVTRYESAAFEQSRQLLIAAGFDAAKVYPISSAPTLGFTRAAFTPAFDTTKTCPALPGDKRVAELLIAISIYEATYLGTQAVT